MLCFRLLAFIVQHMKHSLIGQTFWWSLAPPRIRGGATPIQQSTHNAKCTHFNSTHWRFFFLYSTPLRRRKSAAALAESITAVGDGTGTKLTTAPTITVIVVQKNDHRLFQFVFSQTAANSALVLILRARERERVVSGNVYWHGAKKILFKVVFHCIVQKSIAECRKKRKYCYLQTATEAKA